MRRDDEPDETAVAFGVIGRRQVAVLNEICVDDGVEEMVVD